ncbi:hypothetical protein P7C70_g9582, partial [Phenoliferia sp. Uapishka_3]
MVPSVFVLILRLASWTPPPGGSGTSSDARSEKEEFERMGDAELISVVGERKRSTVERGIKLAVILLTPRHSLEDPSLDSRLSLIRRQSGLDSRASLFVISPVPPSEVVNFVVSFKGELWASAMDYYREHGRRGRRKRARGGVKGGNGNGGKGLSEKGWEVRADYKMGFFDEMRGEVDVALKCVFSSALSATLLFHYIY